MTNEAQRLLEEIVRSLPPCLHCTERRNHSVCLHVAMLGKGKFSHVRTAYYYL